jgi:Cu+-exporting ATPase
VTDALDTIRFPVTGMTCSTCVNRITRALKRLDGVDRIHVDLGRELVTLRRRPSVSDASISGALQEAGYVAHLEAAVRLPAGDRRGLLAGLLRR